MLAKWGLRKSSEETSKIVKSKMQVSEQKPVKVTRTLQEIAVIKSSLGNKKDFRKRPVSGNDRKMGSP